MPRLRSVLGEIGVRVDFTVRTDACFWLPLKTPVLAVTACSPREMSNRKVSRCLKLAPGHLPRSGPSKVIDSWCP